MSTDRKNSYISAYIFSLKNHEQKIAKSPNDPRDTRELTGHMCRRNKLDKKKINGEYQCCMPPYKIKDRNEHQLVDKETWTFHAQVPCIHTGECMCIAHL